MGNAEKAVIGLQAEWAIGCAKLSLSVLPELEGVYGGYGVSMRAKEALQVFGLNVNVNFAEIKEAYRRACSKYHPDRNPAGLEMMKVVNEAYASLQDYIAPTNASNDEELEQETLGDEMNAALNAVIGLGLTIEVCGSWIWVSGDTRTHREILKVAGYRWAPKKLMWHWRPADYKSHSRGKFSMDEIRSKHGSKSVVPRGWTRIEA